MIHLRPTGQGRWVGRVQSSAEIQDSGSRPPVVGGESVYRIGGNVGASGLAGSVANALTMAILCRRDFHMHAVFIVRERGENRGLNRIR